MANTTMDSADDCFRVISGNYYPFSYLTPLPDGSYRFTGVLRDVLDIISAKYGKCFTITKETSGWGKKLPNGTWTGMINQLINAEMDILGSVSNVSPELLKALPTSEWMIMEGRDFVYNKPKNEATIDGFLRPYHGAVWACCFGYLAVVSLVAFCNFNAKQRNAMVNEELDSDTGKKKRKLFNGYRFNNLQMSFLFALSILLSQATTLLRFRSLSMVCLCIFWMFGSLLLTQIYKINLIAMLSLPNIKIPFDTVQEFLSQDTIEAVIHSGSVTYQELSKEVPNSTGGRLYRRLITEPDSGEETLKMMRMGYAGYGLKRTLISAIGVQYTLTGTCPFYMTQENSDQKPRFIIFSEEFKMKKQFRDDIRRLKESGILDVLIMNKYQNFPAQCAFASKEVDLRPLSIKDFYGVFILLGAGLGIAFIVFLMETNFA